MQECTICCDSFSDERAREALVPCGHVYCSSCISKLRNLKCPECRMDFENRRDTQAIVHSPPSQPELAIGPPRRLVPNSRPVPPRQQGRQHPLLTSRPIPAFALAALGAFRHVFQPTLPMTSSFSSVPNQIHPPRRMVRRCGFCGHKGHRKTHCLRYKAWLQKPRGLRRKRLRCPDCGKCGHRSVTCHKVVSPSKRRVY